MNKFFLGGFTKQASVKSKVVSYKNSLTGKNIDRAADVFEEAIKRRKKELDNLLHRSNHDGSSYEKIKAVRSKIKNTQKQYFEKIDDIAKKNKDIKLKTGLGVAAMVGVGGLGYALSGKTENTEKRANGDAIEARQNKWKRPLVGAGVGATEGSMMNQYFTNGFNKSAEASKLDMAKDIGVGTTLGATGATATIYGGIRKEVNEALKNFPASARNTPAYKMLEKEKGLGMLKAIFEYPTSRNLILGAGALGAGAGFLYNKLKKGDEQ